MRPQDTLAPPNPSGRCQCGCGQPTSIAPVNDRSKGWVKGEHVRFVRAHNVIPPARRRDVLIVRVEGPLGCWVLDGGPSASYVRVSLPGGGQKLLHRLVYESLVGPIPPGHELHHEVCEHKACFNPLHVRPLTKADHRRLSPWIVSRRIGSHCRQGHEMTPENTYRHPTRGGKECRRCRAERSARRYRARRAIARPA